MNSSGTLLTAAAWSWLWTAFLAERVSSLWWHSLQRLENRHAIYPFASQLLSGIAIAADLLLATWCATQLDLPPPLEGLVFVQPHWAAQLATILFLLGCLQLWRKLCLRLEMPRPQAAGNSTDSTSADGPARAAENVSTPGLETSTQVTPADSRQTLFRLGPLTLNRDQK